MKIAKADLVPTDANLLLEYCTFVELEAACRLFTEEVKRVTSPGPPPPGRGAPAEEQVRLNPLPGKPFTVAFGTTRRVNWDCTISVRYSVPHELVDTRVWARFTVTSRSSPPSRRHRRRPDRGRPASTRYPGKPVDHRRPLPAPR